MRGATRGAVSLVVVAALITFETEAQLRVNVMPGYPNSPSLLTTQRKLVRPSVSGGADNPTLVWGNVNGGLSAPPNATYTWSFSPNQNLSIVGDGSFTGAVTAANAKFLAEEVRFYLQNGSTRETVTATLTVNAGALGVAARSVELLVVSTTDTASDEPLERLQIDVNIAIEDGLRYLYLHQNTNGSWDADAIGVGNQVSAGTAFAVWAFQNQNHLPSNDPNDDVYAEHVQRGLDFLFSRLSISNSTAAPRALLSQGATANNVSDMNSNQQTIVLAPGDGSTNRQGYACPIVAAAIIASAAPQRLVTVGPATGRTYRSVVEDFIDWAGTVQNYGAGSWGGRGGWDYMPSNSSQRSDMSINSWYFLSMEGAREVFGITVPDWIKRETESALVAHQANAANSGFGYTATTPCCGYGNMATTGGGLSGLSLVQTENSTYGTVAQTISGAGAPLNTIAAKRTAGIGYLGSNFHIDRNGDGGTPWGNGNRNNFYAMWTIARALRLTAATIGLPQGQKIHLSNQGVTFDWETGETFNALGVGQGDVPGAGAAREGYFNWLARTQQKTGTITDRGRWNSGFSFTGINIETSCGVLVLTPRVFASTCPQNVVIPVTEIAPATGSTFAPGTPLTLSGRAVSGGPDRPILEVQVNGQPTAFDVAGRFYFPFTVATGNNTFTIRAVDACGHTDTITTIVGSTEQQTLANLSDVTLGVSIAYSNTTFNHATNQLIVTATACNVSNDIIDAPLLLVVDNIPQASVSLANADGITPVAGKPYFVFLDRSQQSRLLPGQCTPAKTIIFNNPNHVPLTFSKRWLAQTNLPPAFTTAPPVTAVVGVTYQYQPGVNDPNGDAVTFVLNVGPGAMTVNPKTGATAWTPTAADIGTHNVSIRCTDGRGGSAVQSFVLDVPAAVANRPPLFTTAPPTQVSPGAALTYAAAAVDPDGDAVSFTKIAGPSGLAVLPGGIVTWPFALNGVHTVTIRASDPSGAFADQTWALSVGSASTNPHVPSFVTSPPGTAIAGFLYRYQAVATDADPGQVLVYSLITGPVGVQVNSLTGELVWTPGSAQLGQHNVALSVADGAGGIATQAWVVTVVLQPPNRPPVITSAPATTATLGQTYSYQVTAVDPDQDPIHFLLVSPPTGATIDPNSGLLTWDPPGLGTFLMHVHAADDQNLAAIQDFAVVVSPANHPPTITSTAPTAGVVGATYHYDVNATDPDNDPLSYALVSGPPGMSIDTNTGVITWLPVAAQAGSTGITVSASDGRGGLATQSFAISVAPDNQSPVVTIQTSSQPAGQIGVPIVICVQATDNVSVSARTLTVDNVPVSLANGCYTFTASVPHTYTLVATASDFAGNVGTATLTYNVIDVNPAAAPHVTIVSPTPGTDLVGPTPIVATISATQTTGLSWSVTARNLRTQQAYTLGTGTGTVNAGPLAVVDTTLLPNDSYRIAVAATNIAFTDTKEWDVSVVGNFKLGNFTYSVADVSLPLAGIPITISRMYDSLDTAPGDFGAGWRLGVNVHVSDVPAEAPGGPDPFTYNTRVFVTRTDGRRVGFRFTPAPLSPLISLFWVPQFTPDPGVYDKLEVVGSAYLFNSDGTFFDFTDPYNPDLYKFTTAAGVSYTVSESTGLHGVTDLNGNTLTVTSSGITSSLGPVLSIGRDASGRITAITEPVVAGSPPRALHYGYNGAGDLITVVDQQGTTTNYFYEDLAHPHYLTKIVDPLGRPTVRNVFDGAGRLIAQCGPDGDPLTLTNCVSYVPDSSGAVQTIFNGRGFRTDLVLDNRGNVLSERRYTGQGNNYLATTRTYHPGTDLVHTETDPAGNLTTYEYDTSGRIVRLVSGSGPQTDEWLVTYGPCEYPLTVRDPAGNLMVFQYDSACNLLSVTDSLNGVTQFQYNGIGQLTQVIDTVGNHWVHNYDPNGYPASVTDPMGRTMYTTYDLFGDLRSSVNRGGRRIDFTYDLLHHVVGETWNTSPPRHTSYVYNAAGELTQAADPDSTINLSYWPAGELRSVDNMGSPGIPSYTVSYGQLVGGQLVSGYDGNGNVVAVTDSSGGLTEYEYDALDRRSAVRQSSVGGIVNNKLVDIAWNDSSTVASLHRFSDLTRSHGVVNTDFEYQISGQPRRLSGIRHRRASDQTILDEMTLGRDLLGQITSITNLEGNHAFGHDGLGRLLSATHPATSMSPTEFYSYDPAGNRQQSHLASQYTYGYELSLGGNELVSEARYAYEYDFDGNLTRRTNTSNGSHVDYTWDHRSRLISVATYGRGGTPQIAESFWYDPLDRRFSTLSPKGRKFFVYDGVNPLLCLDPAGNVLERYMYGRVADSLLAVDGINGTRWALSDHQRSVTSVTTDSGRVVRHAVYDSFGNLQPLSSGPETFPFGFQGREWDDLVGLGYFRARYYDPRTGRFLSPDPEFPFGYAFADNSPLTASDPSGRSVLTEYACLAKWAVDRIKIFKPRLEATAALYEAIADVIDAPTPANVEAVHDATEEMVRRWTHYKFKEIRRLVSPPNCWAPPPGGLDPPGRRTPVRPRFPLPDKGWSPEGRRPPYHAAPGW